MTTQTAQTAQTTRGGLELYLEKARIAETVQGYALACDEHDRDALLAVFTEDARAQYSADPWLTGGATIVDWVLGATEHLVFGQHQITPVKITVDGEDATGVGYLISYQRAAADPDTLLMMNSRYDWKFRQVDGGWRISELVLTVGVFEARHVPVLEGGVRTVDEPDA